MTFLGKRTRWLLRYAGKYKWHWLRMGVLSVPALGLMVVRPFLVRSLVDDVIAHRRAEILGFYLAGLFATVALERMAAYLLNLYHARVSTLVTANERRILHDRVLRAKPQWLARMSTGDLITRILSDMGDAGSVMGSFVPTVIVNAVYLAAVFCVLFFFSWELALIVVASIPLYYASIGAFGRQLQAESRKERGLLSEVTESAREVFEGALVIKVLSKCEYFSGRFSEVVRRWAEQAVRTWRVHIATQNVTTFITYVTPVVVLGYGGLHVIRGELTLGTLVAFFSYAAWVYEPIQIINSAIIELKRLEPTAERLYEVYQAPVETGGAEASPAGYALSLHDVHFRYDQGPQVLDGVTLTVDQGEKVALVGQSGVGKSTLVNLLARLWEPSGGSIQLGGINVLDFDLGHLRRFVSIVRGTDPLFTMSVRENIVLGEQVSQEDFETALRIAGVDNFLRDLPNGVNTLVEKGGGNLSDGQRQRIALARAIVRRPRILVLDEATSGVDGETEEAIYQGLKELDCTLLIVSHRLSTIAKADRIVVLDKGKVVDTGRHDELVSRSPVYRKILSQLTDPEEHARSV